MAVTMTAPTARINRRGTQRRLRSLGAVSNAASSSAGAMKIASAMCRIETHRGSERKKRGADPRQAQQGGIGEGSDVREAANKHGRYEQ